MSREVLVECLYAGTDGAFKYSPNCESRSQSVCKRQGASDNFEIWVPVRDLVFVVR